VASYTIISEVSNKLKGLLWEGFSAEQNFTQFIAGPDDIVLTDPAQTPGQNKLSLWLYQVNENEFLKNRRNIRTANPDAESLPPLALNLMYLLTPIIVDGNSAPNSDLIVLGKAMQILYDNGTVLLESTEQVGTSEELRIVLVRRSLEELSSIWESLQHQYRLSVCYEVHVVRIDSTREQRAGRVQERVAELQDALPEVGV
jgi:hypothetical protein